MTVSKNGPALGQKNTATTYPMRRGTPRLIAMGMVTVFIIAASIIAVNVGLIARIARWLQRAPAPDHLAQTTVAPATPDASRPSPDTVTDQLTLPGVAWDAWRTTRGGSEAIAARQRSRFVALAAFARRHSRFYAEKYRDVPTDITDVRQLPPVTKHELMAHFDDWITDPAVRWTDVAAFIADPTRIGELYLRRYLVWTTSGTSGEPAVLLQDPASRTVHTAVLVARALPAWLTWRLVWAAIKHRGLPGAFIFATGGHFAGAVFVEHSRRTNWYLRTTRRAFSVQSPLPDLVRDLHAFQPLYLEGYATALALLAREQEAGRLRIQPLLVVSTAETLTPPMRARISHAFGCPVHEGYACSEVPTLAYTCRCGQEHVNADWAIVEPVDANYQPVPPGQPSYTALVTNLVNRVQPIIRYEIGDSVTLLPEPCPCGSPLPAIRVEGRTDEILAFPTPSGQTVQVLPLALASVVEETPGVQRFQAIQTAPTTLTIRLEEAPGCAREQVWETVVERLSNFLAAQGLTSVRVELAPAPPTRSPKSGKFRQVWSAIRPTGQTVRTSGADAPRSEL